MKRIFMLSSNLLYSQGVENLLQRQEGVEIVGRESDTVKAVQKICELKPDVVVLDCKDLASAPSTLLAQLLRQNPGMQVVTLNLENEIVYVYRGEQRVARNVDDLLDVMD